MSSDRLEGALNGTTSPNGSREAAGTSSQDAAALAAQWSADPR
jgi:hypothetical protein